MSADDLIDEIDRRETQHAEIDVADLRFEEYRQFTGGLHAQSLDREFEIRPQVVPTLLGPWFSRLVKAVRLREVRAMTGFTRIQPPGDPDLIARLSARPLDWLPAIEVRGEGIFLELSGAALEAWEARPAVAAGRHGSMRIGQWNGLTDTDLTFRPRSWSRRDFCSSTPSPMR